LLEDLRNLISSLRTLVEHTIMYRMALWQNVTSMKSVSLGGSIKDVKYNYTANLAGTGDRSEYDIESY